MHLKYLVECSLSYASSYHDIAGSYLPYKLPPFVLFLHSALRVALCLFVYTARIKQITEFNLGKIMSVCYKYSPSSLISMYGIDKSRYLQRDKWITIAQNGDFSKSTILSASDLPFNYSPPLLYHTTHHGAGLSRPVVF